MSFSAIPQETMEDDKLAPGINFWKGLAIALLIEAIVIGIPILIYLIVK